MSWKVKNRNTIFKNKFISLTEKRTEHLTLGTHHFYTIDFPHWVNVVAITKAHELVLVRQYRHGLEKFTLETPGGVVDQGENPKETAKRELLEETGYEGNLVYLGKVAPNPAIQGNYCYIYLALDCERVNDQQLDGTEEIELDFVPLRQIHELIKTEKIIHSLSVVSILKAKLYLAGD